MARSKVPGYDTYPEYCLKCEDCAYEFSIRVLKEEAENTICPDCASQNVSILYISYPLNGPGFQNNYDPARLINGGSLEGMSECSDNNSDCSNCTSKNFLP